MHSLLIIGAGTFATEIEELARLQGYTDIAFLDDKASKWVSPVIGPVFDIPALRTKYDTAIVAMGNNENRRKYHELLKENGYCIPILVHPTAYISPEAVLSPGCIVRAKAVVSRYVKLGESVIVNLGALIDHHCEIGAFSHIMMGAVIRGNAKVKEQSWVKANEVFEGEAAPIPK
ncbi:MAG: hypothetical protein IJ719_13510 [Clostridia bacterium]|nr:hypothetical protein [Clostridia bacterium]